ncbi:MAG: sigma-54-dependent Fis family transcriptional regulator [SAR324 cluster bacterium]|nr:sigma-54-dependent Fis family transcriptional regulator [SAR324 cluster bacterium]
MSADEPTHIMIVDDEKSIRWVLEKTISRMNHIPHPVTSAEETWDVLKKHPIDMAFVDINLPQQDGLQFTRELLKQYPHMIVVIMTGQSSMHNTVEAMKIGAYDYISKPFDIEDIERIIAQVLKILSGARREQFIPSSLKSDKADLLVGVSDSMRTIYKAIGRVAATDLTVLIQGESGTGKELIARSIHQHSTRANQPFIAINCAAIPKELLESELFGHEKGSFTGATDQKKGKFELASQGTLFLDEIGDMPLELQSKLLRVLQEKSFERVGGQTLLKTNMRVIAATHCNLDELIEAGRFRADLFYRLNVFPIYAAPLRERAEDIQVLIEHFLEKGQKELAVCAKTMSQEAMEELSLYQWPGNIRELENVIKSLMITNVMDLITKESLPQGILKKSQITPANQNLEDMVYEQLRPMVKQYLETDGENLMDEILQQVERPLLKILLEHTRGNQQKASKILGINRNTLRKKVEVLGLRKSENHNDSEEA